MRRQFLFRRRSAAEVRAASRGAAACLIPCRVAGARRKIERRLTPAEQLEINRGQQAAIDIGAVLLARAQIDREAPAQRVEAGRRAGKALARHRQRIDKRAGQRRPAEPRQFGIEKGEVELGVVNDHPVVADKVEQLVGDLGKPLVFRQELGA